MGFLQEFFSDFLIFAMLSLYAILFSINLNSVQSKGSPMKKKEYHHNNLKQALIEAGIALMNEKGEEGVSLRKVAACCGVSPAAPYFHFENKEAILEAMQKHVTAQMMEALEEAVKEPGLSTWESIMRLGEAYINFFIEHPPYFKFIFYSSHITFHISFKDDPNAFPPYRLFLQYAQSFMEEYKIPEETRLYCLTNLWATVQGITCLATQEHVTYEGDWKRDFRKILSNGREL